MKETICVLSAAPYEIKNEVTKAVEQAGISLSYVLGGDLMPNKETNGFMGYRIVKCSVPVDQLKELTQVPAFYDADMIVRANGSGKAEIRVTAVKFKKALAG